MMVSIERFIGVNLMMNLLVFLLAARAAGYVRWKRILCAVVMGTAYAVLASMMPVAWPRSLWAQTACMALISTVLFGRRHGLRPGRWLYVVASSAISAGILLLIQRYLQQGERYLAVGCPILALCALFIRSTSVKLPPENKVWLRVVTRMGSAELCALVDTGNRLREPLSGLPVVIVEARLLQNVLEASCLIGEGTLPPGFRLVRYGVLGGEGELRCFRPQLLECRRGNQWEEAPDVWVAIYPGELPPHVDALAPPMLAERG